MQADEVQNAKEPIAAQIDLSGQTLTPISHAQSHRKPQAARKVRNAPGNPAAFRNGLGAKPGFR